MSDRRAFRTFRFGGFELDVSAYELRRHGRRIRMEPRPLELLIQLVDRHGELVTRDEIVERLWSRDVFISIDTSVNTVVRKIRRALGDSGDHSRFKASMLTALSRARRPALRGLTTRSDDDFSVALLDACAVMAEVFTVYQERIANEAFLRTARERRSVG